MTTKEFTDTIIPLRDSMFRVAYHILESRQDAEDALQEVYVRLWNSRDRLDGILCLRSYCITMMKNECIDRVRKARISEVPIEQAENLTDDSDILQTIENKEQIRHIMRLMSRLNENERLVMRMRLLEDMSYNEISEKTGLSNLSLRVLLNHARRKMKYWK